MRLLLAAPPQLALGRLLSCISCCVRGPAARAGTERPLDGPGVAMMLFGHLVPVSLFFRIPTSRPCNPGRQRPKTFVGRTPRNKPVALRRLHASSLAAGLRTFITIDSDSPGSFCRLPEGAPLGTVARHRHSPDPSNRALGYRGNECADPLF
jgi:hypothetical protein